MNTVQLLRLTRTVRSTARSRATAGAQPKSEGPGHPQRVLEISSGPWPPALVRPPRFYGQDLVVGRGLSRQERARSTRPSGLRYSRRSQKHASGVKTLFPKGCPVAGMNPRPTAPARLSSMYFRSQRRGMGHAGQLPPHRASTPVPKARDRGTLSVFWKSHRDRGHPPLPSAVVR